MREKMRTKKKEKTDSMDFSAIFSVVFLAFFLLSFARVERIFPKLKTNFCWTEIFPHRIFFFVFDFIFLFFFFAICRYILCNALHFAFGNKKKKISQKRYLALNTFTLQIRLFEVNNTKQRKMMEKNKKFLRSEKGPHSTWKYIDAKRRVIIIYFFFLSIP